MGSSGAAAHACGSGFVNHCVTSSTHPEFGKPPKFARTFMLRFF
jgi:hypothetical protein